jgi:hypothetical protein
MLAEETYSRTYLIGPVPSRGEDKISNDLESLSKMWQISNILETIVTN